MSTPRRTNVVQVLAGMVRHATGPLAAMPHALPRRWGPVKLLVMLGLPASMLVVPTDGYGADRFTLSCPQGSVMRGVSGKQGAWMDSIQAVCISITGSGNLGNHATTRRAGGVGGTLSRTALCGRGRVMTGLRIAQETFVNSVLAIRCRAWDPSRRSPTGGVTEVTAFESRGGRVLTPTCSGAGVGRGLSGRAGIYVDRLSIRCGPAPASSGTNVVGDRSKPVIFIHGSALSGVGSFGVNCRDIFEPLMAALANQGWDRTAFRTVSFYRENTDCSDRLVEGTPNTSIATLARGLASFIHEQFTARGVTVDVVGSSMGGLVIRAALAGVQGRQRGFPPRLRVEDVVTLGTPHRGLDGALATTCGVWSLQCREMTPGSLFLRRLAHNPQGVGGTEWTLIGSDFDHIAPGASAIGMNNAATKILYPALLLIDHDVALATHARVQEDISTALMHQGN